MTIAQQNMIAAAAEIIRKGSLVAMPTETVYGLAADATNDDAVAKIFEAKERPQFNPLIVHVSGTAMAARYIEISVLAERLAEEFWPGPLTMVLPRRNDSAISLLASAGLNTLAVRMPNHEIAQALIAAADCPLAAPSANKSGSISPTLAEHVAVSLGGRVDMIIDGGPCSVGVESTIIRVLDDEIHLLRPGGLPREEIESFLGQPVKKAAAANKPQAPGMLESHYAPLAALRLNAMVPKEKEAFLGFGDVIGQGKHALNLSAGGNLREAAANLFAHLRTLDAMCLQHGLSGIAAAPVPAEGLGEAINDRLKRAAAPRS